MGTALLLDTETDHLFYLQGSPVQGRQRATSCTGRPGAPGPAAEGAQHCFFRTWHNVPRGPSACEAPFPSIFGRRQGWSQEWF